MPSKKPESREQAKVREVMKEFNAGELRSGPGGKGGRVTNREQAVAIAMSEARHVKRSKAVTRRAAKYK